MLALELVIGKSQLVRKRELPHTWTGVSVTTEYGSGCLVHMQWMEAAGEEAFGLCAPRGAIPQSKSRGLEVRGWTEFSQCV